jgi:hypothetical protein
LISSIPMLALARLRISWAVLHTAFTADAVLANLPPALRC